MRADRETRWDASHDDDAFDDAFDESFPVVSAMPSIARLSRASREGCMHWHALDDLLRFDRDAFDA